MVHAKARFWRLSLPNWPVVARSLTIDEQRSTRMPKNKRSNRKAILSVGQAYTGLLTPGEQEALAAGCDSVINHLFEDIATISNDQRKTDAHMWLTGYLPRRYLLKYTPLFCRQFTVCAITVAWKLAQPKRLRLSSVAEELAAWAILTEARLYLALKHDGEDDASTEETLEVFRMNYFEDEDFLFLFDDATDGIDESPFGPMMGFVSFAFEDWFRPFSAEPSRTAHPYCDQVLPAPGLQ